LLGKGQVVPEDFLFLICQDPLRTGYALFCFCDQGLGNRQHGVELFPVKRFHLFVGDIFIQVVGYIPDYLLGFWRQVFVVGREGLGRYLSQGSLQPPEIPEGHIQGIIRVASQL